MFNILFNLTSLLIFLSTLIAITDGGIIMYFLVFEESEDLLHDEHL